jgi:TfoX/Sxy family transcriptional regulator of competence genes
LSTDASFAEFARDQFSQVAPCRINKMFGEYGLYLSLGGVEKIVALICDNRVFVKQLPENAALAARQGLVEGLPFSKAKPHWALDDAMEDRGFLQAFAVATFDALPVAKPKSKSNSKQI